MPRVPVALEPHAYDVTIESGALSRLGEIARAVAPHEVCALIADRQVAGLWGDEAAGALSAAG
jgi:3-dehydroquinate synthetase